MLSIKYLCWINCISVYEDDQPGGGQMNPGLLALLKWESDCERECPLEWQQPPCSPPCSPIHLQDKNRLSLQKSNPKSPRRDSACETGAASPRGNLTALTSHAFQIVRSPSSMSNTGGAISFCMDNSLKKSRVRGMDVCALMNDTSEWILTFKMKTFLTVLQYNIFIRRSFEANKI